MSAPTAPWSVIDVESFINEYYVAWSGTDEDRIMSYYAENVTLQIPGALMEGKEAVRDQFVRPFITAFPGNHHRVKNMIFGPGVVTVEWSFEAQHKGPFAGHVATGARINLPGCGVYEYDSAKRQITAGRIYFDVGTLLQTITDLPVNEKAAEALHLNERNLSLIINTIPTHIYVLNTEGSVQYVNQAVMEYTGLSMEDVQQEDYRDRVIHPEDFKRVRAPRAAGLRRGAPFSTEQRVLGNDGQYRWFLVRYKPLLDEQGRIVRWYEAAFDIEDRKRAECEREQSQEALRNALDEIQKSESRLRQVIDTIPALAWCNLPDVPNEFLSKPWHEYTGVSPEESHGWGWQTVFHPEDLPPLMERWVKMLTSGEPDEIEARLRRHDGVYRWFLIRAEPFRDESGKIVRWYGTSTDIDDRKRAEEKLRRSETFLAEGQRLSRTGSFSWHAKTDEIMWSEQLYRIYEIKIGEPLTLELIRTRVHPEDVSLLEKMKMIHQAGGEGTNFEWQYRLLMPNRSIKYMQAVAHATLDQDGQLEYTGAVQDVTESKVAEQALTRARAELAHMARVTTLSALTASISHEVNQPIAAAITSAGACLR
ncbi:MAG TPA: PAS domain-containing protein, partial [Terriglobales bacterium]|nr:PAS domain-containing protein [Terriglobales bacterium]